MNDWNRTHINAEAAMAVSYVRNIPYSVFLDAFGHPEKILRSIFDEWLIEQCVKFPHDEVTR